MSDEQDKPRRRSLNPGKRGPGSSPRSGASRGPRPVSRGGSRRRAEDSDEQRSPRSSRGDRNSDSRDRRDGERWSRDGERRERRDGERRSRDGERGGRGGGQRRDDRRWSGDDERRGRDGGGRDQRRSGGDRGRDGERREWKGEDRRGGSGDRRRGGGGARFGGAGRRDDERRGGRGAAGRTGRPMGRGGADRRFDRRTEEAEPKQWRPGLAPAENEPSKPEGMELDMLPKPVRAELRGLPNDLAELVGSHLVAAGTLIDQDPELAYSHALAAKRRASRLAVVREAVAETAYAAGKWDAALNEYRALRRMTGDPAIIPVMADCERALGRHQTALDLIHEGESARLTAADAVELHLIKVGLRLDMGQRSEAERLLRWGITEFTRVPPVSRARLRCAYAEVLLAAGDEAGAREWLVSATALDPDDRCGAAHRLDELDGVVVAIGEDEPEEPAEAQETHEGDPDTQTTPANVPGPSEPAESSEPMGMGDATALPPTDVGNEPTPQPEALPDAD